MEFSLHGAMVCHPIFSSDLLPHGNYALRSHYTTSLWFMITLSHTSWWQNTGIYGQIPDGHGRHINSPKTVLKPPFFNAEGKEFIDNEVTQMKCGNSHCLVLTKKDDVWCFGRNDKVAHKQIIKKEDNCVLTSSSSPDRGNVALAISHTWRCPTRCH